MPRAGSKTPLGDADACRHSEPPSERTARKPRVNMIHYSTNTDKETYGASEGRKGEWAISDACQRYVWHQLTFKASSRLKVFPQPWHALFWDFAECRAWCRLCFISLRGYKVAEITSRTCSHVVGRSPCCTQATRTCTDALPCATLGDLMAGQTSVKSSLDTKVCPGAPLRLNRLVNVLPQPGTGQRKFASFRRRLALAAWVAEVVTCCRST
jgi:hypothetical protein